MKKSREGICSHGDGCDKATCLQADALWQASAGTGHSFEVRTRNNPALPGFTMLKRDSCRHGHGSGLPGGGPLGQADDAEAAVIKCAVRP